jgi:hypothetical protein
MNKIKKVGIVTILSYENSGNRLQNYAMHSFLKINGFEAQTLNIKKDDSIAYKIKNKLKTIFFLLILNSFQENLKLLFKKKSSKNNDNFSQGLLFTKKYIPEIMCNRSELFSSTFEKKFLFFISGSDQVFNPFFEHGLSVSFLEFTEANKRYSYAASSGMLKYPFLIYFILRPKFKLLKNISLREKITNLKENEYSDLLDPTLLFKKNFWIKISRKPKNIIKKNFCFVYILNENFGNESLNNLLEKLNVRNNFILFDKSTMGPSEFVYLIKSSKFVITDSYHGFVFSIIFDRLFHLIDRCDVHKDAAVRFHNLLNILGIVKYSFKENSQFYKLSNLQKKIINKKRNESIEYFKKLLKNV